MTRQFHKMHGLGNDFVVIDGRLDPVTVTPTLAKALGDRHTGIGFDQLVLLEPSDVAALRMSIWNADGSPAEACGNATRCVVALTGAATIEAEGRILDGSIEGSDVEVSMAEPRFDWDAIPLADPMDTAALPLSWGDLEAPMAVNVGNPHLVFFVKEIDEAALVEIGPSIEHDPAFPERINVNVAQIVADGILLRTWERGAGLTMACGTGACATAVAAIRQKKAMSPVRVTMKGGSLTIAWAPGTPIRMRGEATHVFAGEIDLEALA
ncbi:diaminopimelate epimerase [Sphingomonas sp. LY29]|uniref:diaminopimelate epimerase n=1 Tax=Sphingomonas sp. LY29 TaxID=3095341 RepID=UPI002D790C72|nr:diaminopimelate epimerase [Sphingomonas sp. LY29]WRP26029.1 diaminopimelate epimerase [Sphingomonas sp. LY29]